MNSTTTQNNYLINIKRPSQKAKTLAEKLERHTAMYGMTREVGFTFTVENFFYTYNEDSIHNIEGFKSYYHSIDDDEKEMLKMLFTIMSKSIFMHIEKTPDWLEVYIQCLGEDPISIALPFSSSLYELLQSYVQKQINCDVSVDELLIRILNFENNSF